MPIIILKTTKNVKETVRRPYIPASITQLLAPCFVQNKKHKVFVSTKSYQILKGIRFELRGKAQFLEVELTVIKSVELNEKMTVCKVF